MAQAANQSLLERILRLIVWLTEKLYGLDQKQIGVIKFMYVVKDDNPDVGYAIQLGDVTDAEGNVITDAKVSVEVASSDESVVAVNPADDRSGSISFGSPGTASITATVSDDNGNILASGAADFTVTTGDPAAVSSVALSFDGLSEQS